MLFFYIKLLILFNIIQYIRFLNSNGVFNKDVYYDYRTYIVWTQPPSWKYPKWHCTYSCHYKRSSKAITSRSYFFNHKADLESILWALHGFIAKNSLYTLSIGNRLDRRTVSQIIFDVYQMIDIDITDDDIILCKVIIYIKIDIIIGYY